MPAARKILFALTIAALAAAAGAFYLGSWVLQPPERETLEIFGYNRCYTRNPKVPGRPTVCFIRIPPDGLLEIDTEPVDGVAGLRVEVSADLLGTSKLQLDGAGWRLPGGAWENALSRIEIQHRQGSQSRITSLRLSGNKPPTFVLPRIPELSPEEIAATPPPLNVILYVVDTLRADHMSIYGYERQTTPRIDRWAESAYVFDNAYSTGTKTWEVIPVLFGSRFGLEHLQRQVRGITPPVLAEVFRQNGYRAAAFQANFLVLPGLGYARGFEPYELVTDQVTDDDGLAKPIAGSADRVQDRALEWIDRERERPFFLYLQTMDPHNPYRAPEGFAGRYTTSQEKIATFEEEIGRLAADFDGTASPQELADARKVVLKYLDPDRYDECIAYSDDAFGRFLDRLAERGLLRQTMVILTADHGESLGDGPAKDRYLHGVTAHEEIVRIPLIVQLPGQATGRRVPDLVSLIDIAPTVLDAARLPIPKAFRGESLFEERRRRAIAGQRREGDRWVDAFLRDGRWKLIRGMTSNQVYDLQDDPLELNNQARQLPIASAYLRNRLAGILSTKRRAARPVLSAEEQRQLKDAMKALGYAN